MNGSIHNCDTPAMGPSGLCLSVTLFVCQGLSEEQAVAKHPNVDIYTSSFRPMRNTISGSPVRTFMKLVVDADSDKVVGCHMVGEDSAEIMQVGKGGESRAYGARAGRRRGKGGCSNAVSLEASWLVA